MAHWSRRGSTAVVALGTGLIARLDPDHERVGPVLLAVGNHGVHVADLAGLLVGAQVLALVWLATSRSRLPGPARAAREEQSR